MRVASPICTGLPAFAASVSSRASTTASFVGSAARNMVREFWTPLSAKSALEKKLLIAGGFLLDYPARNIREFGPRIYDMQLAVKVGERAPPNPGSWEEFLIFNGGNVNEGSNFAELTLLGMSLSMWGVYVTLDGNSHPASKLARGVLDYLSEKPARATALAVAASMAGIVLVETAGIGNTPDLRDIPAGLVGAALYGLTHLYTMKVLQTFLTFRLP